MTPVYHNHSEVISTALAAVHNSTNFKLRYHVRRSVRIPVITSINSVFKEDINQF